MNQMFVFMVLVVAGVFADGRYYGGGGNMNSGADMDTHLAGSQKESTARCEEITIPMCRGIGYNLTSFPNEMNHETQEEAGLEVHQFWPLVEIKCSPDLKFFLCSIYTPLCIEDYHQVKNIFHKFARFKNARN